jgi:hypothetical protein
MIAWDPLYWRVALFTNFAAIFAFHITENWTLPSISVGTHYWPCIIHEIVGNQECLALLPAEFAFYAGSRVPRRAREIRPYLHVSRTFNRTHLFKHSFHNHGKGLSLRNDANRVWNSSFSTVPPDVIRDESIRDFCISCQVQTSRSDPIDDYEQLG